MSVVAVKAASQRLFQKWFGGFRFAYLPVLVTYFAYGASSITGIANLYFQKDALGITPAEVSAIGFWVGLPWGAKMVAGVASDYYPILGSKRTAYSVLGALLSVAGYLFLAFGVHTKGPYLAAMVVITLGFMVQDVVADALSKEVAETDEEVGQVQALGRMALLVGMISVAYVGGVLARVIGPRHVFALAAVLPFLVLISSLLVRLKKRRAGEAIAHETPLSNSKVHAVFFVGLSYAALGVVLEFFKVPFTQEIVLVVSGILISVLLYSAGISRGVVVAAFSIFCFRAVPSFGQGYQYWAIDVLKFDQDFFGVLGQVGSVIGLIGLVVFRKSIVQRPVSFTLFWVTIAGAILSLPNIGLFYGVHEWFGMSARTFAFVDTAIGAPLASLTMVPMLMLIARTAPKGAEATMFAIMASLMNLALSASELGTRYLNDFFAVTQQDYSNFGRLMWTALAIGILPLLTVGMLRHAEKKEEAARKQEAAGAAAVSSV